MTPREIVARKASAGVKPPASTPGDWTHPRPSANGTHPPPGPVPPARPRVAPDLVRLADVEPQEVPWLWPGRIPLGRITLLVGRPGAGKSFLTCDLAARLSTGAEWPDGGPAPRGDTLFICAEDDPADTIVPRLIGAGADRTRVHLLKGATVTEPDGKQTVVAFDLGNVGLIGQALDAIPGCRLVVIDPVGSYLGAGVDAHRDNEVRGVLAPLAQLAAEAGVAVLLVAHNRKAGSAFADDTALGSRGFVGLARSVLHLSVDDADRERRLLLPGKNNLAKSPPGLAYRIAGSPPGLAWEPDPLDGMHADDVQPAGGGEGGRGPRPLTRDAAADWLADFLHDGPRPVADIEREAGEAGFSRATLRRAHQALGIKPEKKGFAGRWSWGLPNDAQGAQVSGRRCSSREQPEHLRETPGETAQKPLVNPEGAQGTDNLSAFGVAPDDLSTFSAPAEVGQNPPPPTAFAARRFRSADTPEEIR